MKKIIILLLLLFVPLLTSCSSKEKKVMINTGNISEHFTIQNDLHGKLNKIKPTVTLDSFHLYSEVVTVSIFITIEYEISYMCSTCFELNTTKFEADFSVTKNCFPAFSKQDGFSKDDLDNLCEHSINFKTLKIVSYRVVKADGYYVYSS